MLKYNLQIYMNKETVTKIKCNCKKKKTILSFLQKVTKKITRLRISRTLFKYNLIHL